MRGCSCCCWPPYMPAGDRSAPGGAGRQMQKGAGAGRRLVPAREPRLGRDTPSGGGQSPAAASPSPGGRPAGSGPAASSAQGRPGAGSGAEPRLAPPSAGRRWGGGATWRSGPDRTRPDPTPGGGWQTAPAGFAADSPSSLAFGSCPAKDFSNGYCPGCRAADTAPSCNLADGKSREK